MVWDIQLRDWRVVFLSYFKDVETEAQKGKDWNKSHMSVKGTSGRSRLACLGGLARGIWAGLVTGAEFAWWVWECILGDVKKEEAGDEEKCWMTRIQDV